MLDIGWTELRLIGVVALIVVGPKDLPGMFRTLGQFTGKIKNMAREFQRSMEAAADDAGVKDMAKDFKDMSSPTNFGMNKVNEAVDEFKKWSPDASPEKGAKKGPETAKLTEERAEAARKIREKTAEVATARQAKEAKAAEAKADTAATPAKSAPEKKPAKKPANKPAKKTAAKTEPAKKPAAKKPAAKKTAAKKPAAKKPAAKKPAADKSTS